mmetsp:Transcript_16242/g.25960  ORF Transcript_16242/g.25960 Transcript_16242/m.25960 type:complete len:166 (+) Transcript_16242:102-599(+)
MEGIPCLPPQIQHRAFLVPVEVRNALHYGVGHKGVFAMGHIAAGTKIFQMTDLVSKVHHSELENKLTEMCTDDAAVYLRQACVFPDDLEHLFVSGEDAGRFVNHSSDPNIDNTVGAMRDICPGEELVMDYGWLGNPGWYQEFCAKFGVLTEREIANRFPAKQGGA